MQLVFSAVLKDCSFLNFPGPFKIVSNNYELILQRACNCLHIGAQYLEELFTHGLVVCFYSIPHKTCWHINSIPNCNTAIAVF